jgi:hypothetical protein
VKEVNSAIPCFSNFEHFVEDIKLGLGSLMTSSDVHVKREANLVTHSFPYNSSEFSFSWDLKNKNYVGRCRQSISNA